MNLFMKLQTTITDSCSRRKVSVLKTKMDKNIYRLSAAIALFIISFSYISFNSAGTPYDAQGIIGPRQTLFSLTAFIY